MVKAGPGQKVGSEVEEGDSPIEQDSKDGMRPQLIPEHEIECLSSPQVELLSEYMKKNQTIDPVKLDLCECQAIEPVHPYHLVREDNDSIVEVSSFEALVINDASKIIESLPDPEPQQDTTDCTTVEQPPHLISEPHAKKDYLLVQVRRSISKTWISGQFLWKI